MVNLFLNRSNSGIKVQNEKHIFYECFQITMSLFVPYTIWEFILTCSNAIYIIIEYIYIKKIVGMQYLSIQNYTSNFSYVAFQQLY